MKFPPTEDERKTTIELALKYMRANKAAAAAAQELLEYLKEHHVALTPEFEKKITHSDILNGSAVFQARMQRLRVANTPERIISNT